MRWAPRKVLVLIFVEHAHSDPTQRFSNRVENYLRYRPDYPVDVLDVLQKETGLKPSAIIADIGSGTGISSELFLRNGNTIFAVEPNDAMRRAAETLLARYADFRSVAGTAEATTLDSRSVDYVIAGQAFHWFDTRKAKAEFKRILRSDGWAVLMWNTRRTASTPFLFEYETLLQNFGTDYHEVQHRNIDVNALRPFFNDRFETRKLYNEQRFDFEGLKGRLLSSSYVPSEGDPRCEPMLTELRQIFDRHADSGQVVFEYDTELYFGRIA